MVWDLRHFSKIAAHFLKKKKTLIYSVKYPNKENRKKCKQ